MHYFSIDHNHELTEHEFLGCCKACERSHRLVKKHLCDFHRRISSYSPAGLLMVAAMARPKEEIFLHLAQSLPGGSLVSFRLYEKGLRRLLDREGDADFILPTEFNNYCRIRPQPPVNNTVVVVRKC